MFNLKIAALAVLSCMAVCAQVSQNTVTVTASRNTNSGPDQAVLNVTVNSGTDQGLDQVIQSLAGSGISASELVAVNYQAVPVRAPQLQWIFQITVPLASLKTTTASLTSLQESLNRNTGISLSFSVQNTRNSGQSQNCDFSGLMGDATANAQRRATAAGLPLGRITGLAGSISDGTGGCALTATFMLGYSGNAGPHVIAITASRSTTAPPDEIASSIILTTDMTAGLDDVNAELAAAGIGGATFSNVYTGYNYGTNGTIQSQYLIWSFTLTTPLAKIQNTVAQLLAAQQSIAKQHPGQALSFGLGGVQASTQSQPPCSESALVADATVQAQKLAAAAGTTIGGIVTLSNGAGAATVTAYPANRLPVPVVGVVGTGTYWVSTVPNGGYGINTTTVNTCSLSVQFQLY